MILNQEFFTLSIDPLEGVRAISVHAAESIGGTAVRHENGHLMESLRRVTPEVPGHVGVLDTGLRVSLLAMNEVGELDGVLDEENRSVVSNHVVVALFSVMLDGETTRVTVAVVGTTLTSDS